MGFAAPSGYDAFLTLKPLQDNTDLILGEMVLARDTVNIAHQRFDAPLRRGGDFCPILILQALTPNNLASLLVSNHLTLVGSMVFAHQASMDASAGIWNGLSYA